MIQTLTVLKAEPTCHTDYCSEAAQVYGVKVVVDRPAGVSPLQLANLLRCHGARALLGQATALADDPYFLPDGWVYIGLEDAGRNFVVTLNGDTVANNLRILHRATAFAGAHGLPATN